MNVFMACTQGLEFDTVELADDFIDVTDLGWTVGVKWKPSGVDEEEVWMTCSLPLETWEISFDFWMWDISRIVGPRSLLPRVRKKVHATVCYRVYPV